MKIPITTMRNVLLILSITALFFCLSCEKPEREAKVETGGVNDIMATSAKVAGEIIDAGEGITEHGHCWGTNPGPTTNDSKTNFGSTEKTGSFISLLKDLDVGRKYYVRAYAVSEGEILYGNQATFTTLQPPSATTNAATNITATTATLNGTVNANVQSTTVTFEYGTTTSYGNTATASQSPVTGSTSTNVSANISGLTANTTYHFRVKAVNIAGTTYGSDQVFTTVTINPPSVTTNPATDITTTTATLNGTVNANWQITTVTFEYGTTTSYGSTVTSSQSPVTGSASTNVSADISGLTANTTYHFRVKAESAGGTTYGSDQEFTTTVLLPPSATTNAGTNITATTATLNGTVNANGQSTTVTFEYGLTTSYGSTVTAIQSPVTGSTANNVSANISGLTANTTYHFRVKAVGAVGTTYGSDQVFTTSSLTTVTDYDGNIYNVVQIGSQLWMNENLKTTKYNDGTSIPLVTDNTAWSNLTTPGYCLYNNDASAYKTTYGALYNWYTVNTGKLCPTGWHVPTDTEWKVLTNYLGGESVAGGKLKETGTTHWTSPNTGATNVSGFAALPGGYRNLNGNFYTKGINATFWSSTEYLSGLAWHRELRYNNSAIHRYNNYKENGFSVRCLRD